MSTLKNSTWFEAKVRADKPDDNGKVKKVVELVVIEAVSWTDAEKRIAQEWTGEYEIQTITKAPYKEVSIDEADVWFKCRVDFITLDEKTAKEKKTRVTYLINAYTFEDAKKVISDLFRDSVMEYRVSAITETKVIELYQA